MYPTNKVLKKAKAQYLFLLMLLIGCYACKKSNTTTSETKEETQPIAPLPLLEINYENGMINSGITNLNVTDATAADASYLVSPGHNNSKYAIAHKVTLDDNGYFSDNHWRSESATANVNEGRHVPGDERRYEFSLLLKDWKPYVATQDGDAGDIIFQGKLGGGGNPAWYLMTKRNTIAFRMPNDNLQINIVNDYRPHINKWIDFRIDMLWANTATGYYKVYVKLPGETEYQKMYEVTNFKTFNPDNPEAKLGYLKWGLYRPASSTANNDVPTRIIWHDDIKVYKLPL